MRIQTCDRERDLTEEEAAQLQAEVDDMMKDFDLDDEVRKILARLENDDR